MLIGIVAVAGLLPVDEGGGLEVPPNGPFGTTGGSAQYGMLNNQVVLVPLVTPADMGTVTTFVIPLHEASVAGNTLRGVIYTMAGALVATSAELTSTGGPTSITLTFTGATLSPATEYYFGTHVNIGNEGADVFNLSWKEVAGVPSTIIDDDTYADGTAATLGTTFVYENGFEITVNYTAA